jgi:hypothetical protein
MNIPNNKTETRQLWTAVAHVKPNPGNDMLHGAPGAFVAVIVLAKNARDVFLKVKSKVNSYEFMLGRIEDIEPITQSSQHEVLPELLKLGDSLTPENPVAFGSFHSYKTNT